MYTLIDRYQLAEKLRTEALVALILGVNTFVALLLNSILTAVLVDEIGLGLPVNEQFVFYG